MNRINLLYKMDGLLTTCKTCERNDSQKSIHETCTGCQIYTQLREIGENLGRKKQVAKFEMSVFEYVDLLAKNSIKNIAKFKGISEATLYNWIKANKDKIREVMDKQPGKVEKKHSDLKTTINKKEIDTANYKALYTELQEQVKQDKKLIKRLEEKVTELENLQAACEDVENETAELQNEVSRLREERNRYQEDAGRYMEQSIQKDYTLENWKNRYKTLMEQNAHLEKENRTMREVIRLWA